MKKFIAISDLDSQGSKLALRHLSDYTVLTSKEELPPHAEVIVACKEAGEAFFGKGKEYRRVIQEQHTKDQFIILKGAIDPSKDFQAFLSDLKAMNCPWEVNVIHGFRDFPLDVKIVTLDLETTGFNPYKKDARILSVSMSSNSETSYVGSFSDWLDLYNRRQDQWKKLIIVGQNIKFDLTWLLAFGVDVYSWKINDTLCREHMIDENAQKGLDQLVFKYTSFDNFWAGFNYESMTNGRFLPRSDLLSLYTYNGYDTAATMLVYLAQGNLDRRLNQFEMDMLKTLLRVEAGGIFVDQKALTKKKAASKRLVKKLSEKLQEYLLSLGITELDPTSTKQLGRYLYEIKKYPIRQTEKGNYSTDKEALEELAETYPEDQVLQSLVEIRTHNKLISTYYENMEKQIDENASPIIHPNFNQFRVVTWRLSSSGGINFQNIPARNSDAVESLFVSRYGENGKIIKIDYSQMELRLLADVSGDKNMLDAFSAGKDFHQATADRMGVERTAAKTLNFKVVYGGGTPQETEGWFKTYSSAKKWVDKMKKMFLEKGYTKSPLGHTRHLGKASPIWKVRSSQERQAFNSPIQGFAGNITKIGLYLLHKEIDARNLSDKVYIINSVHDSILIDCPTDLCTEELLERFKVILDIGVKDYIFTYFGYEIQVPLVVDITKGPSWGQQE